MNVPLLWALIFLLPILCLLAYLLRAQTRKVRTMEQQLLHAMVLARTDPLTGLLNRTAYEERLACTDHSVSGEKYVCFAMLDINHFKHINDKNGHYVGDQALELIASALRRVFFEEAHSLFRVGGDEYALILQGLSRKEADERFDCFQSLVSHAGLSLNIPLSVAVGYVFLGEPGAETVGSAFRLADRFMYENKKQKL